MPLILPKVAIDRWRGGKAASAGVPTLFLSTTKSGLFTSTWKGAGTLVFDWGDGSAPESFVLTSSGVVCSHTYPDATEKPITITGDLLGVTYLSAPSSGLTNDISEIAKLRSLTYLSSYNTGVTGNISSLTGMSLTYLFLATTGVTGDISALTGMSLTNLYLYNTGVTGDISALTGMSLTNLNLFNTGVTGDISALTGMSLTNLHLFNTGVTGDISALTGMSLTYLHLGDTGVGCDGTPFTALTGCNIQIQNCNWSSTEVDAYLIAAAAAGHNGCSINIGGNNAARTSASDAALAWLVNPAEGNNTITVNE